MTTAKLIELSGNPTTDKAGFTKKWIVDLLFPQWLEDVFPRYLTEDTGHQVTHQYVHKHLVQPFMGVMEELVQTGLIAELRTFDGIWNIRPIRGSKTVPSRHSWALAVDLNAKWNPLGTRWTGKAPMFSGEFLGIWKKHGWSLGASFKRGDAMHFEWNGQGKYLNPHPRKGELSHA